MDKLLEHEILEYPPNVIQLVRKQYNLDKPGEMDAAIDVLDQWIKKQAHFTRTDFPREYLERTIIFTKGSIERAKVQMDKLFTMKTLMPQFFEKTNTKTDFENLNEYYAGAVAPKLTDDLYRIYVGKMRRNGFTTKILSHSYASSILLFDHIKYHDYCTGFISIMDFRGINIMELVSQVDILESHRLMSFITEGFQFRLKAIHVLTDSTTIDLLVQIFKQITSKKMGARLQVHNSIESLHKLIPKNLLPEEFGGELKSIVDMNNDWNELLSTEASINEIIDRNKAKVNEKLREGGVNSKEDLLGLPGSFRTLVVD